MDPDSETPKHYREFVTKIGGQNPYGDPLWRVILADRRTMRSGGLLHDLPTGDISIFAVDAKGKVHYNPPGDSVTSGVFELPRYPVDGWISERWFPAEIWGTREEWNRVHGESVILEPFPERGDYFLVGGPWPTLPELSDIECAIRMWEDGNRRKPTNMLAYYKQILLDEETARERRREKLERELAYMRTNELVPVLKSGSLEAQRFRNELNASIGDRSHLGAVHDA